MYPIPPDVFRQRLAKWQLMEDRRIALGRDQKGNRTKEYWSLGVCRLMVVYHRDGAELLADRGIAGTARESKHGPIAFNHFGE